MIVLLLAFQAAASVLPDRNSQNYVFLVILPKQGLSIYALNCVFVRKKSWKQLLCHS